MPATQQQMDEIDTALADLGDLAAKMRVIRKLVLKFRRKVDLNDIFNSATYADMKTLFTPLYVTARDDTETAWTTFKDQVANNL